MKPALLTLSFLLFAFTTTKLTSAFSNDLEEVLDNRGNPVLPSGQYYIFPVHFIGPFRDGGGLIYGQSGNSSCPVTVLQDYSEVINGLPVKFTVLGVSTGIIRTGTPLAIEFSSKPNCAESPKWTVVVDEDFPKGWVGIGGAKDHPGNQILGGTFNIQRSKYGRGYNLVFCATGLGTPCFYIGRYDDKRGRRLILTKDEPYFEVVFVDVTTSNGIRSVV